MTAAGTACALHTRRSARPSSIDAICRARGVHPPARAGALEISARPVWSTAHAADASAACAAAQS
jgi:hypothetical protein